MPIGTTPSGPLPHCVTTPSDPLCQLYGTNNEVLTKGGKGVHRSIAGIVVLSAFVRWRRGEEEERERWKDVHRVSVPLTVLSFHSHLHSHIQHTRAHTYTHTYNTHMHTPTLTHTHSHVRSHLPLATIAEWGV